MITDYYNQILRGLQSAVAAYIPCKKSSADNTYNVPGWNDFVQEKHQEARSAYMDCNQW